MRRLLYVFYQRLGAVRMLRKLGCDLPIQFWHYGEEELDGRMRKLVDPYGVECVDARSKASKLGRKISAGWPLKPFSILHSAFEEVLALDADNIPIRNPEYLFEYGAYRETGAIFWPDVSCTEPGRKIWNLMGVPFRDEPEFESGQMVVHKALSWEPLNLAMWMNEEGRADFIYDIIWGDKDTFRFAWHKFGFPFAMPPVPVQVLSVVGGPCCAGVMCQHDLDGDRIFQHRNMHKWELFAENPWVPGFLFEGECREFLAELRAKWNGRIGATSKRPTGRIAECSRQLRQQTWLLRVFGKPAHGTPPPPAAPEPARTETAASHGDAPVMEDRWPAPRQRGWREFRFVKGGHCGRWSDSRLTFWSLGEGHEGVRLSFAGKDGAHLPTAELTLHADGTWRGWTIGGKKRHRMRLIPLEKWYHSIKGANGNGTKPAPHRDGTRELHVFNSAHGIGDHLTALYACVGAVNAGLKVTFHTRFPQWLARVFHPGLTITGDLPPGLEMDSDDAGPAPITRSAGIDLNREPTAQLRYGNDKARWYADAIDRGISPARPATIDREVGNPRFDFDRYVVLAPFSAWARRDWPGANWTRLTHLLRNAGYEVVAMGTKEDAARFESVFNETTALWAIDHGAEWVMDAMLGAACVIGNDSGMVHVAGLLGIPVVSIHAHLPPDFLFTHASVTSLTPKTSCVFCRWQPDRGYTSACDAGCSALGTIGPERVLRAVGEIAHAQMRRGKDRDMPRLRTGSSKRPYP